MADEQQERVTNEGLASGPWRVEWFGQGSQVCVVDADGTTVANLTNLMMSKEDCERHARLLVQARNDLLLTVCKGCGHEQHTEACAVVIGQRESMPPVPISCECVEREDDTFRVKDLISALQETDPMLPVVMSKNAEGNDFSPLSALDDEGLYEAASTWSGYVYSKEDAEEGGYE